MVVLFNVMLVDYFNQLLLYGLNVYYMENDKEKYGES